MGTNSVAGGAIVPNAPANVHRNTGRKPCAPVFAIQRTLRSHAARVISPQSFGGDLARRFATGRCSVVRVLTTPHGLRKAVPAPLSSGGREFPFRAGTTPRVVV